MPSVILRMSHPSSEVADVHRFFVRASVADDACSRRCRARVQEGGGASASGGHTSDRGRRERQSDATSGSRAESYRPDAVAGPRPRRGPVFDSRRGRDTHRAPGTSPFPRSDRWTGQRGTNVSADLRRSARQADSKRCPGGKRDSVRWIYGDRRHRCWTEAVLPLRLSAEGCELAFARRFGAGKGARVASGAALPVREPVSAPDAAEFPGVTAASLEDIAPQVL